MINLWSYTADRNNDKADRHDLVRNFPKESRKIHLLSTLPVVRPFIKARAGH
ncbi:hypothetical protein AN403_5331 [Pseudomonas fluorescens]|uniref:Uncharacterized protein n=1 Tax=Pseudomonas fluorescens TaxID=294 RepID=A0A0N8NXX0_PSEFL|nr:hypothetical protein AN403_5331 [Pseudomonas fluorescens]